VKLDRLRRDLPRQAIIAEAGVDVHHPPCVVHAEHAGEASLIGHDGAVEDAIAARRGVARDHRVAAVAPDDPAMTGWAVLPGQIRDSDGVTE